MPTGNCSRRFSSKENLQNYLSITEEFPTRCESIIGKRDPLFFKGIRDSFEKRQTTAFVGVGHIPGILKLFLDEGYRGHPGIAMITAAQEEHIERHAYLPEHVPEYVTAISQTEAFLFGNFLAYAKKGYLILIGYPLGESFDEKRMEEALEEAVKRLNPESVSLMAPSIPASLEKVDHPPSDHYYRLDLSSISISQKLRNMLKRAGRELTVGENSHFDEEHREMVAAFLEDPFRG